MVCIINYVFNLEYEKNTREVLLFFQEYVFGQPDQGRKSSTYLSVSTDIQRITQVQLISTFCGHTFANNFFVLFKFRKVQLDSFPLNNINVYT